MFRLGEDTTEYKKLTSGFVSMAEFEGEPIIKVDPAGLRLLAEQAFVDVSHLMRASHLQNLAKILGDDEASRNDRFVAWQLLKNATISREGVLPMCQDTGTIAIMGKRGRRVWTNGKDEAELVAGSVDAYLKRNLRYSMLAPISTFKGICQISVQMKI